jgi:hypothetical protein
VDRGLTTRSLEAEREIVMNGTKIHPITPVYPQSADKAAHRAGNYFRGDSDPNADELLRRARERRAAAALFRLEVEAAYLERDREGIAAYREWAQGVPA